MVTDKVLNVFFSFIGIYNGSKFAKASTFKYFNLFQFLYLTVEDRAITQVNDERCFLLMFLTVFQTTSFFFTSFRNDSATLCPIS